MTESRKDYAAISDGLCDSHRSLDSTSTMTTDPDHFLSSRDNAAARSQSDFTDFQSLHCPYLVGAVLTLSLDKKKIRAKIVQIFTGGINEQFSNSCTVLLSILDSNVPALHSRQVVLKILDWRYMSRPRRRYHSGEWNSQQYTSLSQVSKVDRERFVRMLHESLPEDKQNNIKIKTLQHNRKLPSKPIYMDLFEYILSKDEDDSDEYVQRGLIDSNPTPAQREIFLQVHARMQLVVENNVAEVIRNNIPSVMPRTHGIFRVATSDTAPVTPTGNGEPVYGLLMDRVIGKPIPLPGDLGMANSDVKQVLQVLVIFQLQLIRCDLELSDGNGHNFILDSSTPHKPRLSIVDYGAITFVQADLNPIFVKDPLSCTYVQLPAKYCRRVFDVEQERDVIISVINTLSAEPCQMKSEVDDILSQCLWAEVDTREDRFIWYTIVFHLIYSCDTETLAKYGLNLLQNLQAARQIMVKEFFKDSPTPWWERSTRSIAVAFNTDPDHACNLMQETLDTFRSRCGPYESRLPLLLVQNASREGTLIGRNLLFPEFSLNVQRMAHTSPEK